MSKEIKKQFGVWMNTHQATIVGHNPAATEFIVLGNVKNPGTGTNSNENTSNNHEKTLARKYFKEIGHHLENAQEIYITGTGTSQEEFKHFLEETPQFKNAAISEGTSNPMTDQKLVELVSGHFK
jgi:stalled ribosome rescue protein Dom34